MSLRKKPVRLHNLKRPKIRADMRKENLYKLAKALPPSQSSRTFFQQKWKAKSLTRAYHGDHIREKLWTRMFDRRTNAVVPMDPSYLARHDGTDQSAGRGSGLQKPPSRHSRFETPLTPYMQMVYHPLERRLDIAIFRSLFAASAKQARQLVLHGQVKVNGKPMIHPSYLLNPGDMFQVNPERVMYCMGKRRTKASVIRNKVELKKLGKSRATTTTTTTTEEEPTPEQQDQGPDEDDLLDEEQSLAEAETGGDIEPSDPAAANKKAIKSLMQRTRGVLDDGKAKKSLNGKQKQDFRALLKNLRSTMSRAATATPSALDDLEAQFASLMSRVGGTTGTAAETENEADEQRQRDAAQPASEGDANPALKQAIEAARENPIDPSKPWATPWRPRAWMSAFAFIPRYLEVNHNICAAVYLRHPVCGPGFAEVPTPYDPEVGQLAHAWYLRRR